MNSPGSIDPGHPLGLRLIIGSLGFLSGAVFAVVLSFAGSHKAKLP